MMGAVINIGAVGEGTMIDMGAVLWTCKSLARTATLVPALFLLVLLSLHLLRQLSLRITSLAGANAVVIEGIRVEGAVVAAGAVVVEDVPANAVVAGCPARVM